MSQNNAPASRGKYATLIYSLIAFIAIIIAALIINYQWSSKIEDNTTRLDAVGEVSDNMLFIISELQALELAKRRGEPLTEEHAYLLADLQERTEYSSELLEMLQNGGEYDYGDDVFKPLKPIETEEGLAGLEGCLALWHDYNKVAEPILAVESVESLTLEELSPAATLAKENQEDFYDSIDTIWSDRIANSLSLANMARLSQLALLAIVAAYLALYLFYFIRRLNSAEAKAEAARKDVENIMHNVPEGLFLVGDDLTVGSAYSSELENLIGQKKVSQQSLDRLLLQVVSTKDVDTTKAFVDQLFNDEVIEDLISELNPLDKVLVLGEATENDKYLNFKFKRVYENDEITKVLVSVSDITKEVELEQKLDIEREQSNIRLQTLAAILHVDRGQMDQFLQHSIRSSRGINAVLQEQDPSLGLSSKIDAIYRETHTLKGNASALELHSYVSHLDAIEGDLRELKGRPNLSGNDFLSVTMKLKELMEHNNMYQELMQSLGSYAPTALDDGELIIDASAEGDELTGTLKTEIAYQRFAEQVAARNQKAVNVSIQGLSLLEDMTLTRQKSIDEILLQLIRNAVVHGIETPAERQRLNKPDHGRLIIDVTKTSTDEVTLLFKDDGAGINQEALRQKAVATGQYTSEQAQSLSEQALYKIMFMPGVSTASSSSEDAGRGYGTDIILDRVKSLQAKKMTVTSKPNKGSLFKFVFPIS